MPYRSTSTDEVFELRNELETAKAVEEDNKFIKAKLPDFIAQDEQIQEIIQEYIKPQFSAY
jgi:hypothetical protein